MRRKNRGSSLAEIVVASGLLLLVVRTLLVPIEASRRSAVQAQARMHALRVATDVLEQVRAQPFASVVRNQGTRDVLGSVENDGIDTVGRNIQYAYSVDVTSPTVDQKIVTVDVSWNNDGIPHSLHYGTRLQGEISP